MLIRLMAASVKHRFLLAAAAVGLIIAGSARLPGMPVDVLPEISPVAVQLQTQAPGLSAEEVETLVTTPLEKELLEGVMGVVNVTSDSVPGMSAIVLHFASGTNVYQARQLVQERLTSAFVLPNVSRPPVIVQPVSTMSNAMIVGLTSSTLSPMDLSVLARWTIVPRLLGVAGVAEVATFGQADRQLQVLVNPATLAANHVSLAQVIAAAGNSQLVSPLTYLQGSTPGTGGFIEDQNQRLTVRPILPSGTTADLAQVPVTGVTGGHQMLLGQVAEVVQASQPPVGAGLIQGKPGLVLEIDKLPGASVTRVTASVERALAQLRPSLTGVRVSTSLFRPASYLASAEHNVRTALLVAAVLALLTLLALLLSIRLAVAALGALSVSLITATLIAWALGYSFNSLTLLGLLLALAVVVDDAVRCGSAAVSKLEPGAGPEPWAGPRPWTVASVTALVAAAPIFAAAGLTARFLHPMIVAFGIALLASVVVALTVGPAFAALVMSWPPRRTSGPRGQAVRRRAGAVLARVLRGALTAPAAVLALLGVMAVAALALLLPRLHPGKPAFADRDLVVHWNGAPGMSLPELNRMSWLASQELLALPGVQNVAATLGQAIYSRQLYNSYAGNLWVTIKPGVNYGRAVASVRAVVSRTPGLRGSVSTYAEGALSGVLTGPPPVMTVRVYGPDLPTLTTLADQVQSVMTHVPGLAGPLVRLPAEQPTINVEVNLTKAAAEGLSPGEVRREAGTLLAGLTVGNFFEEQKVFDVVVWAQPAVRSSLTAIAAMPIDNGDGGQVPLGDVATLSVSAEPVDIQHQQMSPFLDVTAPVSGSAAAAGASLAGKLRAMRFPLGYHAVVMGNPAGGAGSRGLLVTYALAALFGIVLLVQAAIGSWRLTMIVLLAVAVPLAAAADVAIAIGPTSFGAAAGLLGVLAISLRQATAVAARLRRRPADGGGRLGPELLISEVTAAAGPVLTSAAVTMAVLAPFIAIGDGAGTELVRPAAIVIASGLAVATAVNLLVLPAAYLTGGPAGAAPDADSAGTSERAGDMTRPGSTPSPAAVFERWSRRGWSRRGWAGLAAVALSVGGLTGCGPATSADPAVPPPARMELTGPGQVPSVVLTPLGVRRIGIETAPATTLGNQVAVPYGALLYEPDGQTAVYIKISALVYTRQFVNVASINGDQVLLSDGLTAGTQVVVQGAEELLGVQNGVGVET
jgi:multidrug efflux pump subunit AcrB